MEETAVKPSPRLPPWQPGRFAFAESDRRLVAGTFRRLVDVFHSVSGGEASDCLLLLTTCRNRWYAANALYVEARKWCQERQTKPGFGDGLSALGTAVSGTATVETAARRASRMFAVAADYLSEFEKKQDLFLNRFEEVREVLLRYAESIADGPARLEFLNTFANVGSGSGRPEDALVGPEGSEEADVYFERLREWFALARPLTGLARTFISEVLGLAAGHPDKRRCRDYLDQMRAAALLWEARGFRCPPEPPATVFDRIPAGRLPQAVTQIDAFLTFSGTAAAVARQFLSEMLPAVDGARFPLRRPSREATVTIHGRTFALKAELLVCITDMRNSTGDRHLSPELKVRVEGTVEHLRQARDAASQTLYDDSRVIACEAVESLSRCVQRLSHVLEPFKTPDGFEGIRIGCTCGDMLFDFHEKGDWKDIRRAAPLDSADNTIATAARLMGLDKLRWEDSTQGRLLREALGDWATRDSLVFLDSRVYEQLPTHVRSVCRDVSVLDLKGIGKRQCWAIPVEAFVATSPGPVPA